MRVIAIVQARLGSTRFPKKVLKIINSRTLIEILLKRLAGSSSVDRVVVATSTDPANEELIAAVEEFGFVAYAGSENDVLDRYLQVAIEENADVVIRITGDCPLVDPALVDFLLQKYVESDVDYLSNTIEPTFPDGLDVEIFSMAALRKAAAEADSAYDREHVTPYIKTSPEFRKLNVINDCDLSNIRWTVDEQIDFEVVSGIFNYFAPSIYFTWEDALRWWVDDGGSSRGKNSYLKRDEGAKMNRGQKLWRRAKGVIPGGNMLLSKRSEMFLPEQWPTYFSRASGCTVWDLEDNSYVDMSLMGVGTNTLGYGHPDVDSAVRAVVNAGNMSTLNCPEEVYLAEKLVEIHPWADMVKFARSGGEANAISVRIARAASNRDKVAVCGYHGWHDWYLSANLSDDDNLSTHLLPGLAPNGVPRSLKGSVIPFSYNNIEELNSIVSANDIGVIKMEVSRNYQPEGDFLNKVRKLASERGIVLIFDECTSGFRQALGGLHKVYGVEPDIAVFGKALGNGYAITAVVGRREIMESAQSTFVSSTFWTERIGPAAGLKTLEVMSALKSWSLITDKGNRIKDKWSELASKYQVGITQAGLPALAGFNFVSTNAVKYKTLLTQEMLKRGYLATTSIYTCIDHTDEVIARYFDNLEEVFSLIGDCERGEKSIDTLLDGPLCHEGFKRLN